MITNHAERQLVSSSLTSWQDEICTIRLASICKSASCQSDLSLACNGQSRILETIADDATDHIAVIPEQVVWAALPYKIRKRRAQLVQFPFCNFLKCFHLNL